MLVYKRWLVQLARTTCESMHMCYHTIHRGRFNYQINLHVLKVTVPSVSAKSDNRLFLCIPYKQLRIA